MKIIIFFILFFFSLPELFAQNDLVKNYNTYKKEKGVKGKYIKEIFLAISQEPEVKHGYYLMLDYKALKKNELKKLTIDEIRSRGIKIDGQYSNGKKTGEWKYYGKNRELLKEGSYKDDLKNGFWRYFYGAGSKEFKMVQENGYYELGERVGVWEQSLEFGKVIRSYNYDNGTEEKVEIRVNYNYPKEARKMGIEGKVVVKFSCSEEIEGFNIEVLEEPGEGFGDSVVKAMQEAILLSKTYGGAMHKCGEEMKILSIDFRLD